jgi:uncharacterized protein YdhG (YjbR/CyaY superfamily)
MILDRTHAESTFAPQSRTPATIDFNRSQSSAIPMRSAAYVANPAPTSGVLIEGREGHRIVGMKPGAPQSVDDYIASQPEAVRPKLEQVRATIRRAVPDAIEIIGYGMPGFKLHGKTMLYFAGFKQHYSLFAASGSFFATLADELAGYKVSKGTVQFPLDQPVPVKLIARIAKLRAEGITAEAKASAKPQSKARRKSAK